MKRKYPFRLPLPKTAAFLSCLLAVAVLEGCEWSEPGSREAGRQAATREQATTAGVEILLLRVAGRIGAIDSSAVGAFGNVHAMAVGQDGAVYLAGSSGPIRHYAPNGRLLRLVGEGQQSVVGLAILPGGRLAVRRAGGGPIDVYDGGRLAARRTGPAEDPSHGGPALEVDDAGGLYWAVERVGTIGDEPAVPLVVRLIADGGRVDTIPAPDNITKRCATRAESRFQFGRYADFRFRYLPSIQWDVLPDGTVVTGCSSAYEFELRGMDGEIRRVTHDGEFVPVSPQETDSFVRAWALMMSASRPEEGWSWDGSELPDRKPAYQQLFGASDGRVWVWPSRPSVPRAAPYQWPLVGGPAQVWTEPRTGGFDVFGTDGEIVAHYALPPGESFGPFPGAVDPVIRGDTMWTVAADSTGAEYVARLEVPAAGSTAQTASRVLGLAGQEIDHARQASRGSLRE